MTWFVSEAEIKKNAQGEPLGVRVSMALERTNGMPSRATFTTLIPFSKIAEMAKAQLSAVRDDLFQADPGTVSDSE